MKLATFRLRSTGRETIGAIVEKGYLDLAAASGGHLPARMIDFLSGGEAAMKAAHALVAAPAAEHMYAPEAVELRAPVPRPGKILHTSCNFGHHLSELTGWKAPEWQAHDWSTFHFEHPTGFLQASSSIVGTDEPVVRPVFTRQLDHEIELAIVIGRRAKNVPLDRALDYVAGYAVFNDMSARDIQAREHANKVILLGKSFDSSCPFGPVLVTRDEIPDPAALDMEMRVNGKVHQEASTAEMIYKPDQLVSWWSNITLEPGDVITSGSPAGVIAGWDEPRWLEPGDVMEAEIKGLGVLRNPIAAAEIVR